MDWLQALILGIIQGLTEYLPVSSSGHLAIGSYLFGLQDSDNLMFTVLVHVATVLSTFVILWSEIDWILKGLFKFKMNDETKYFINILISMIPVGIVGVFFKDYVEEVFGSGLLIVGIMLLVTAALLTFSYYAKPRIKQNISWKDALIIGIAAAGQQEGVAGAVLIPHGNPSHPGRGIARRDEDDEGRGRLREHLHPAPHGGFPGSIHLGMHRLQVDDQHRETRQTHLLWHLLRHRGSRHNNMLIHLTESGESTESSESGESGDSGDSSESSESDPPSPIPHPRSPRRRRNLTLYTYSVESHRRRNILHRQTLEVDFL